MNIDSILEFLQQNRLVVGYLIIGILCLILLVFLFIKSITTSKQPALEGSPKPHHAASMPSIGHPNATLLLSEQPDTKLFIDQLKRVAEASQKIIHTLDTEIATKEKTIAERTDYIQRLEQQIADSSIEQVLSEYSEKLKKENEKKLAQVKQQALSRAYQMWFLGFLIGLFVAIGIGAAYYFLVLKA